MIVHVLILWGVIAAAAGLAVVVHRRRTRDDAPEYQSALQFVGAAYGLLIAESVGNIARWTAFLTLVPSAAGSQVQQSELLRR